MDLVRWQRQYDKIFRSSHACKLGSGMRGCWTPFDTSAPFMSTTKISGCLGTHQSLKRKYSISREIIFTYDQEPENGSKYQPDRIRRSRKLKCQHSSNTIICGITVENVDMGASSQCSWVYPICRQFKQTTYYLKTWYWGCRFPGKHCMFTSSPSSTERLCNWSECLLGMRLSFHGPLVLSCISSRISCLYNGSLNYCREASRKEPFLIRPTEGGSPNTNLLL